MGFQNFCEECGGIIQWKLERRNEYIDEWLGICRSCGAYYAGSYDYDYRSQVDNGKEDL